MTIRCHRLEGPPRADTEGPTGVLGALPRGHSWSVPEVSGHLQPVDTGRMFPDEGHLQHHRCIQPLRGGE